MPQLEFMHKILSCTQNVKKNSGFCLIYIGQNMHVSQLCKRKSLLALAWLKKWTHYLTLLHWWEHIPLYYQKSMFCTFAQLILNNFSFHCKPKNDHEGILTTMFFKASNSQMTNFETFKMDRCHRNAFIVKKKILSLETMKISHSSHIY
jgi:hypothetical protein